jgi:hypothetical protein
MIFQLFLKVMRWILIAIIVALVLFCILFAILQSKWAKEQIKEKIISYLKNSGVEAKIVDLEGQPPFTWTLKEADFKLKDNCELKLFDLKFRFAILPLFKGSVVVNYLKVDSADYTFFLDTEPSAPLTLSEIRLMLPQQIAQISLPLQIDIRHFEIDHLTLSNRTNQSCLTFALSGSAKVQKEMRDFALDIHFYFPDLTKTCLEATIAGSEKKDWVAFEFKINIDAIPAFLSLGFDGSVVAEMRLEGPWESWKGLCICKSPLFPALSDSGIKGHAKGTISGTRVENFPLLNRDWKFKTQFCITPGEEINIDKFLLLSDLIHIKAVVDLHEEWNKSKASLAFSMPDLCLFCPFAPFLIGGEAKGKAVFQEGSFEASFETRQLLIEKFAANTTKGSVKGSYGTQEWEAEVNISSSDATIPFESSFAFEYVPHTFLSLIDFNLIASDASIDGFLCCDIADELYEGSIFAKVEHLDKFTDLYKEDAFRGEVALELVLSSKEKEQDAKLALIGKNMRYEQILFDDLSLSAEIENLFDIPQGRFNLLAAKIYTPTFYLDRLNFSTHFDELNWPFFFDAEGRIENPFQCYAQGFWQREKNLFSLELTQFFGELSQTPFALKYPSELQWGTNDLNLSPFDFKIGDGNLFATFELSPVRSLGQWELKHFPLELLSCIRPRLTLTGFISAAGFIDASKDNIEGVCNATLEESGVLHFGKKEPFMAKGSLQAHLNRQMLQLNSALNAINAQFLDFNASLPIVYNLYPFSIWLDKDKNTSAELLAEGKLQDLFDFVNLGTNYFTGLFSCRLFLSQTLLNPSLQGQVQLQNGTYENYFTGIELSQIDATFEARNNEIHLIRMHARDDKSGQLEAKGKIFLKPEKSFPYSFEAEMHKLHALGFDMIDCDLTGPVYLTGNMHHMSAEGNLLVDEAKIQITERLPYEIPSLPVTFVNMPKHLGSHTISGSSDFDFKMDLELTSEGNVRVEGRGLSANLEGNVHLYGTNTHIIPSGALKLIKGEYTFSGKIFKLTEAEIIFNDKPSPSAYLNITGTLSLPDITITAMMRGPLMSPQLTFQSNPQKPTSSILALILFNKEITEINHPEAIQLASTLVSLSGGAGPDVLESIRKSIGIDRLNIASKPGSDELAVQIGKYLTRGIMITLSQSATSSQVIVEVELPKNFVFQAETQEEEEGKFSLKWRKSY